MYTDEQIFKIIAAVKEEISPFKTTKDFVKKYQELRVYPAIITLSRRYGGIRRLLARVEDWQIKRCSVGIMKTGEYITQAGDAVMNIKPNYNFFEVMVAASGKTFRWKIPRSEI